MRSASKARLELFESIRFNKPTSIYELAQFVKKDRAYVLREARALESMGLIQLVKESEGKREKLKPVAMYDRILIEVDFAEPSHPKAKKKQEVA